MIDLIIPFYDSTTIDETLASIAYQTDTDIHVYLIDDGSNIDYSEIVSFYKKYLDITYYKLEKNGGPGVARQYGIDHSNSPYLMFMDSDDSLSGVDAIEKIKKILLQSYDLYIGTFVEEVYNDIIFHTGDEIWLHGKVYSRDFITRNHVHFNDTRKNEDNFFNQLFLLHAPKVYHFDEVVYIYRNNMNSITRRNNYEYNYEGCIYYAYNISEAMREAKADSCDDYLLSSIGYRSLIAIYFYIIEFEGYDVSKMIKYAKKIYSLMQFSLLTEREKDDYLKSHLRFIVDDNYSLLLKGYSFDEYMKMLGDSND